MPRFENLEQRNLMAADVGLECTDVLLQTSPNDFAAVTYGASKTANSTAAAIEANTKAQAVVEPSFRSVIEAELETEADDQYEPNNSINTATQLGTLTATRTIDGLRLIDKKDWYEFTTSGRGTSGDSVAIQFQNANGNLQLQLYSSRGQLLRSSKSTLDVETISLNGLSAGTYYVRVFGANGATNSDYSLTINPPSESAPPSPVTGDFDIQFTFSGLSRDQQAIFEQAATKWESIIVGDLPNVVFNGRVVDDLLISAEAASIDGRGRILGQAGPDRFRNGSQLPYHGSMEFDTADIAAMETAGTLFSVILHEIGHVLGIGTLWTNKGLISGANTNNPQYTGAQATAQYNTIFGTNGRSVPVENTGGVGTRNAHWRDSIFRTELMTGFVGPGAVNPLSRITAASLADLGYTVDIGAADPYSKPGTALVEAAEEPSSSATDVPADRTRWPRAVDHLLALDPAVFVMRKR